MTILYVATSKNRLKAIEVDGKTGDFIRLVQDINPIFENSISTDTENASDLESRYNAGESRSGENSTDDLDEKVPVSWSLGSYLVSDTGQTEWIERHPTFDSLLYVFTSFWNRSSAVVTTYRILGDNEDSSTDNRARGRLKKLGSVQTKGLHVSHITFSPDQFCFVRNDNGTMKKKKSPSSMCVGHYMDGSLSFFDCSRDAALDEPLRVVVLPEVRPETRNSTFPNPLPSIHHVTYNPSPYELNSNDENRYNDDDQDELCKYLLVSDTSKQGRVWTFAVDSRGLPISDKPDSYRKVTYINPPSGWLTRIVTGSWVAGLADYRIRRCIVHPKGRYVYMLMEFNTVVQVYEIDRSTGRISGDCLQEISVIDPEYFGWKKMTGAAVHASAEMYATATELFVSNRGFSFFGSSAESGIRVFSIENDGAKLVPKQSLGCEGPVRHFVPDQNRGISFGKPFGSSDDCLVSSPTMLFAGSDTGWGSKPSSERNAGAINNRSSASVETFVRRDPEAAGGTFERAGVFDVGMDDITCIAVLE
eukprot:CAMPEP_0197200082 /NCGR_PEP_ID=MMETSP1423-20130617/34213_1 /TAXON_ID=476441 /ORGANISM="Pseudo-nitzschia heimii, Strain UNC1101" /LENGTH=532 /DNA_ID=CAMNT_0042653955 /DNA_START=21 /DNA_END=1619 /DNA_ORIENTATION=-